MGMLGKDVFDLQRPNTNVKVLFGKNKYWIEHNHDGIDYCRILLEILEMDLTEFSNTVEHLETIIDTKSREEAIDAFCDACMAFTDLPIYNRYLYRKDPDLLRYICIGEAREAFIDWVLEDEGIRKFLNFLKQAREDILMVKRQYSFFLEKLESDQISEKKKGQRKLPLAEQISRHNLDALISGRSLGEDPKVDAPLVKVQYMVYKPMPPKDREKDSLLYINMDEKRGDDGEAPDDMFDPQYDSEIVEKMYFDRIADFVYVEFIKGMQKGYILKRCKNCKKWFLQMPGASFSYCDRIAPGEEEKTCRDIGAVANFQAKVQNNEIWKVHQRAYKKYYARVLKKNMTKADFEVWAREAEALRDEALEKYEYSGPEEREQIVNTLTKELNEL